MDILESKFIELLLDQNHIFLVSGIFCLLYIIRKIPYINIIFKDKNSWSIPIINLGLSNIGIFLLKLTPVTSIGAKICIALIITGVSSYAYKLTKPLLWAITKKLFPGNIENPEP